MRVTNDAAVAVLMFSEIASEIAVCSRVVPLGGRRRLVGVRVRVRVRVRVGVGVRVGVRVRVKVRDSVRSGLGSGSR